MDLRLLAPLPLIFFTIHDFEEILFIKLWIDKNKTALKRKFPAFSGKVLKIYGDMTTERFSFAVAEEFVILSVIILYSLFTGDFLPWFGAFMAFFLHLIVHILQTIMFRGHTPGVVTAALFVVPCFIFLTVIVQSGIFSTHQILFSTIVLTVLMILNLIFAHFLARKFESYINRSLVKH